MPRLIIVDKLIRSEHGHYLEYAMRVGAAFEREGYEPVYLGNRKFEGRAPKALLKAIEFDFERVVLGPETKERKARERARKELEQSKRFEERLKLSSLGVASAALVEMRRRGEGKEVDRLSALLALLLSGSVFGLRLVGLFAAVLMWPFRAIWRALRAGVGNVTSGPFGRWLGVRFEHVAQRLAFGEQFTVAKRLARGVLLDANGARAQARTLAATLLRLNPQADDIVLCATVKEADLSVYLEILKAAPKLRTPQWSFIFREPIFAVQGSNYTVGQAHRGLRSELLGFKALEGARTTWWTDTDELAEQYIQLGAFDFGSLPIVMPEALAELASKPAPAKAGGSKVVTFGYFGDARPEKGYPELPEALALLSRRKRHWIKSLVAQARAAEALESVERELGPAPPNMRERMLRRRRRRLALLQEREAQVVPPDMLADLPEIALNAQSNFNVPEGVLQTRAARMRLQAMDDIGVATFAVPPPSEQYVANFGAVDAVLLHYTHDSYIAGSSGVFAEAIMAGRPVVVTDQTWGGRRLRCFPAFVDHLWQEIDASKASKALHPQFDRLASAQLWQALSPELTHLALRAEFIPRAVTDQVEWSVEFALKNGTIERRTRILSSRHGRAAAVIEVPFGAYAAKTQVMRLNPRLTNADWAAEVIGLNRSQRAAPLYAVGVIVQAVAELPGAIAEVARYADHYHQTARSVAGHWAIEHSRERLVEQLLSKPMPWSVEQEEQIWGAGARHDSAPVFASRNVAAAQRTA